VKKERPAAPAITTANNERIEVRNDASH